MLQTMAEAPFDVQNRNVILYEAGQIHALRPKLLRRLRRYLVDGGLLRTSGYPLSWDIPRYVKPYLQDYCPSKPLGQPSHRHLILDAAKAFHLVPPLRQVTMRAVA